MSGGGAPLLQFAGGPLDGAEDVLAAEHGVEGGDVVAELGVEEAAIIESVGPGDGMVFAHGLFVAAIEEELADGFVGGFVDAQ